MRRIYVDRYTGKITRCDIYRVNLTLRDGTVLEMLEPRRLFPFSNHNMFITLLDSEEREVALIRDFEELDADSRRALEECFAEYYLIPEITAIHDIITKFGTLRWVVETDRGPVSFQIRNRHSDIKNFRGTNRVLVRDSNDNRYEIENLNNLDRKSWLLVASFL